jgi:hypothetical protein
MKKILIFYILLLFYFPSIAQIECGTDSYNEMLEKQYPEIRLNRINSMWKQLLDTVNLFK